MMNNSNFFRYSSPILLFLSSLLSIGDLPAQAIGISFDSGVLVNATDNVSETNAINLTDRPDGFNDPTDGFNGFFTNNFLLLGADPSDNTIATDSITSLPSSATSNSFTLSTAEVSQDIVIEFDWVFQGNADGVLGTGLDAENFSLSLVDANNSNIGTEVFLTTAYGSQRNESFTINSGSLNAGDYIISANLVELVDVGLTQQSSAAGIGNVSVSSVPFDFSPTQGLFLVGGFLGLSYLSKKRKQKSQSFLK